MSHSWLPSHENLRELLTNIYEDRDEARRVVKDVGLDWGEISAQGTVRAIWQSILEEAIRQEQVETIVELAAAEFPRLAGELRETVKANQTDGESPLNIQDIC